MSGCFHFPEHLCYTGVITVPVHLGEQQVVAHEKRTRNRHRRPPSPEAQRAAELARGWEALLKRHARPLEKGFGPSPSPVLALGSGPGLSTRTHTHVSPLLTAPPPYRRKTEVVPSLASFPGVGATVPVTDELAEAKRDLRARTGQLYNKGGLQLMTEEDMKEQRTGAHRRR